MSNVQEKIDSSYRSVFNSTEGKKVLRHLMSMSCIWDTTLAETSELTALNEGKRQMMLGILHRIRYKPEAAEFVEGYNEAGLDYVEGSP